MNDHTCVKGIVSLQSADYHHYHAMVLTSRKILAVWIRMCWLFPKKKKKRGRKDSDSY